MLPTPEELRAALRQAAQAQGHLPRSRCWAQVCRIALQRQPPRLALAETAAEAALLFAGEALRDRIDLARLTALSEAVNAYYALHFARKTAQQAASGES